MLETAKWRLLVVKHAVDRYAPGEELGRHATRAFYVGTVYVGVKAEVRVIGDPDRIFLVFIGDDGQDGAENLLPGNGHVVLHIDKHSGLYEVTGLKPFWMAFAADQHVRALVNAFADVGLHPLVLLLAHHRADCGLGIGRITDRKFRNSVHDYSHDLVEAALRHQEPGPRNSCLSAVHERDREGIGDTLLQCRIAHIHAG